MRIVLVCMTMEVWPIPDPIPSELFKVSREILKSIWKIYWSIKFTRKEKGKIHLVPRKYHPYLCNCFPFAWVTWNLRIFFYVLLQLRLSFPSQSGPTSTVSVPQRAVQAYCVLLSSMRTMSIRSIFFKLDPVHTWLFRALKHRPTAFSYPNLIPTVFSLGDHIFSIFESLFMSLLILLFLHVT